MSADFDVARISLDFTLLVAGDHVAGDYPATREAAVEARAIFEGVRARPYLERLDAAMVAFAERRHPIWEPWIEGPSAARSTDRMAAPGRRRSRCHVQAPARSRGERRVLTRHA